MIIDKNVKYLNDRVKMTGFGETHEAEIRENMGKGLDYFTLTIKRDFGDEGARDTTESILLFNKGKEDWYHFNSYDMRISNRPDDPAASKFETVKVDHKFKKNTYTLKEMYNLKLGGSVEKQIFYKKMNEATGKEEEISFSGYKKADHRKLTEYNSYQKKHFNWPSMESELRSSEAIKLLKDPDLADGLIRSMKKGNIQRVILKNGDTELVRWIAIDAEFKKIGIYEANPRMYVSNEMKEAKKLAEAQRQVAAFADDDRKAINQPTAGVAPETSTEQGPDAKIIPLYPDSEAAKVDLPGENGQLSVSDDPTTAKRFDTVTGKAETEGAKDSTLKVEKQVKGIKQAKVNKVKGNTEKNPPARRKKTGHKV